MSKQQFNSVWDAIEDTPGDAVEEGGVMRSSKQVGNNGDFQ